MNSSNKDNNATPKGFSQTDSLTGVCDLISKFCSHAAKLVDSSDESGQRMGEKETNLWKRCLEQLLLAIEVVSISFNAQEEHLTKLRLELDSLLAREQRINSEIRDLQLQISIEKRYYNTLTEELDLIKQIDTDRSLIETINSKGIEQLGRADSMKQMAQVAQRRRVELEAINEEIGRLLQRAEEIVKENILLGDLTRRYIEKRVQGNK